MKMQRWFVRLALVLSVVMVSASFAALLNLNIGYPRIVSISVSANAVSYNATNQWFTVGASPQTITFSSSQGPQAVSGIRSLQISALVDNTGTLIGSATGSNDLVLSGTVNQAVDGVTNTYSGVLLTGAVTQFGSLGGGTSQFEFRFTPTGGKLLSLICGGQIAVHVNSVNSTFSNSFAASFQGPVNSTLGPEDIVPPQITCPTNITVECQAFANGLPGAYVTFPMPVATDPCDTNPTIICTPPAGSFFALLPLGVQATNYTVFCLAQDQAGNTNACTFTITVEDTLPPEFANSNNPIIISSLNNPIVLTNDPGECYATFTFPWPLATDIAYATNFPTMVSAIDENGAVIPLTDLGNGLLQGQFPVTLTGTNIITVTANDGRGNTTQHQTAIQVLDLQPPVINCPPDQLVECTNGPVFFETPLPSDNCPNVTVVCTPPSGSLLGLGSYLIVCTATDASGNTNQCTFTVTVQDTTPPVISCPANVTVECGRSTDPASTGTATATDNCDTSPKVTFIDAVSGNCPRIITRTWTATDFSGNSNSCVQIITITDTTPPTISCPPDKQLQCGDSTNTANTGTATATDTCSTNVTITFTDAAVPANCTGKAGIDRTWKATDACGNISTCVQHLTFVDTTPPVVIVPTGSNLGCNPTNLPTDASVKALVTATDNCSAAIINVSHVDATSGCSVTRTFTVTATDGCGNTSAAQTVVYTWTVDTTAPVITCPPNAVVNSTNPAPAQTGTATATDNCDPNPVVTYSDAVAPGSCAGSYVITRTWTATDACGNSASCAQVLTYYGNTSGVFGSVLLHCNSTDTNLTGDAGLTNVTVTLTDASSNTLAAVTTDVSGAYAFSNLVAGTYIVVVTPPTNYFETFDPDGTNDNQTMVALAGCQQAADVDFGYADMTTPVIVGVPAGGYLGCNPTNPPTDAGVKALVSASDDRGAVTINVSHVDATSGCGVTRAFTVTATGTCGSSTNASTVYTWTADTTPPVLTSVPAGGNLGCNPTNLPTDASVKSLVTATDTCSAVTINVSHVDATSGCGVTRTFTVTATDGCGNASAPQTVVYTWTADTTAPTVTVPTGSNLGCNPTNLPTDASVKALVTATDSCSAVTINVSHVDATSGCGVTRTFTVTATDGCGNTSAAQTVVYTWTADTTAPTVTVPTGSNLGCNPTNLPTDASVKALVTASDNCSAVTINVSHVDVTSGCGVTRTFTVTATDGCGNASAPQTVVYTWTADTTAPIITCPPDKQLQCGDSTNTANTGTATATDNCGGLVTITFTDTPASTNCTGKAGINRTWMATDACGNSATCVQHITFVDNTPPIIICPSNVTVGVTSLCSNTVPATQPTIAAFLQGATATDSCGRAVTITNNAPSWFPLGTNTVTFTAIDACGNSASCQAKVIVVLQPLNCEPIQTSPFFCQHHFDLFGNCQFATFEGNVTLSDGDQPTDFRTATNAPVGVTVTVGTNSPTVVYCNQVSCSVQSDGCGGEAWEFLSQKPYERLVFRFTDNQKYNALIDTNLPSSAATGFKNVGKLSTVSIGATQTRFFYAFQYATQPITVVVDGIVLVSVSNNVATSTFPISQSGATVQVLFPERLIPGNIIQWYATGNPSMVSATNLIYSQQASATGNSTATYFNEGGVFEIQVPVSNINFKSTDRAACVQFTLGQPGVTTKVGCGSFCQGPFTVVGICDWQFGKCSDFDDEFNQECWQP